MILAAVRERAAADRVEGEQVEEEVARIAVAEERERDVAGPGARVEQAVRLAVLAPTRSNVTGLPMDGVPVRPSDMSNVV